MGELTKAMALLEQSNTQEEMFEQLAHLAQLMSRPGREELRLAFADWVRVLWGQRQNPDNPLPPPPELSLEETKMTLQERVARWSEPWIEQGKQQGIELGKEQGIELGKEQGIELGKREHGREQVRRLAEERFGTPTAERLSALLRREDDLQRLDALAVAVVRCETGDELLRQASNGAPSA